MGRKTGLTEAKLMALADFEASPDLSELEKLALRYAVAMSQTPAEVPEELVAALRRHLSDRQLVELTATIAWENYRARFNRAFDVESQGFSEGAFCPVPARRPLPPGT